MTKSLAKQLNKCFVLQMLIKVYKNAQKIAEKKN